MEEQGGAGAGAGASVEVVQLEQAVEMLLEHLVVPVLPRGKQVDREQALSADTQEVVARQVHAAVLLYNYYHRKQFPELEFADADQFCRAAALTVSNKNLLMYMNLNHGNGSVGAGLSATDKAITDACDIAEMLDHTKDSPEMFTWPISKVAVLLVNLKKNLCLLQRGTQTMGVLSIFEKDIETGGSLGIDMRSVQGSAVPLSQQYLLQTIAYGEVELKTGMKRTDLCIIEEHRVYSLSKKGTAAMLFVLRYDQTVDSKLMEMPLPDLIKRMSGPIFESGLLPITTSVAECYHLLPYKEVLSNIQNRDRRLGTSLRASLRAPKSHVEKQTIDISTPKKSKLVVKAAGGNGTNNYCTSKKRTDNSMDCKRKYEALRTEVATDAEHGAGKGPTNELQASIDVDKYRIEKNSKSINLLPDIIPTPDVGPVMNDHALKSQEENDIEKSGGITGNMHVQKYATLQLLRKMRDDTLHEHLMLGDRSAEYEMDIQTILTETEMTPKVTTILKKYEKSWNMTEVNNPISSGVACQTMNIKRKTLKEAILLRDRCQELDDICHESNWVLPRYRVLPSTTGDMYQASVHLMGLDFSMSADGDMKVTTYEARNSAASNMLSRLQEKARDD